MKEKMVIFLSSSEYYKTVESTPYNAGRQTYYENFPVGSETIKQHQLVTLSQTLSISFN